VDLPVEVKERITWGIIPIVSLDGDEEENNEYGLRFDENCLLGLGKDISVRASTMEERNRYAVSYDDPQVMFTHFTAGAGVTAISYDWEDTGEDEVWEAYVYGGYRPTYETEVYLRVMLRQDDYSSEFDGLDLPEDTTKVGAGFSYSDVDYFIDSLRGVGASLLVENGSGDEDFTKANLSVSYNYRMANKHWVRLLAAGGTEGDDAPWYELFTVGGGSSIRGYAPGYRGGHHYVRATAQYEAPVFYPTAFGFSGTVALVGFVDWGDAWLDDDDPDYITGAGTGVRVYVNELQAFTFNFDVGYGFEEEEWQPHLTFGGTF
jgi:outer membrane protein assembly factor BamA